MMRRAPQPITACVHGAASGGGFALALGADVRLPDQPAPSAALSPAVQESKIFQEPDDLVRPHGPAMSEVFARKMLRRPHRRSSSSARERRITIRTDL